MEIDKSSTEDFGQNVVKAEKEVKFHIYLPSQ